MKLKEGKITLRILHTPITALFFTLELWLVIFSVILFILKLLRNSLNSFSAIIPIPTIPYLANIPFYQCTFLLPLLIPGFERIKKITYFLTLTLFKNIFLFPLFSPTYHICSSPLTPTPPQPFHHQLGLSQRNDSWNHKSKGGRDLKGQLIPPPN